MTEYEDVIELSIRTMSEVVGRERAVTHAQQVEGMTVSDSGSVLMLDGDGPGVLGRLVDEYVRMAGDIPPTLIASALREEYDVREMDLPENITDEFDSIA